MLQKRRRSQKSGTQTSVKRKLKKFDWFQKVWKLDKKLHSQITLTPVLYFYNFIAFYASSVKVGSSFSSKIFMIVLGNLVATCRFFLWKTEIKLICWRFCCSIFCLYWSTCTGLQSEVATKLEWWFTFSEMQNFIYFLCNKWESRNLNFCKRKTCFK